MILLVINMNTYYENINYKIYTNYNKKSYDYESHFHSKTELLYCYCGAQNIKVGNIIYTLKTGDAIIIFPNVIHEYFKCDAKASLKTESISIMIDTDYLSGFLPDLISKRPITPLIEAKNIPENSLLAFEKIKNITDNTELLGWTFIVLSGLIKNTDLIPLKEADEYNLAPRLIWYINENFQKPLTIKYLSKEFGYSTSYITHVFYDQLKIPFRTYLGSVRSKHAANLICTTAKSLTEIAYESGFLSLNTFCRCFKKHFLQTPSQYRKKYKNI